MNSVLAVIYETWAKLYNVGYSLIFSTLYDDGGYVKFGLAFICIPLICWFAFYYLWRYPYGKIWHWLLWLVIIIIVVSGLTFGIANTEIFASNNPALIEALANSESGYEQYAKPLPLKYAFVNGGLTLIIGVIYSLIMKQFSRIQMHLPV